MSVKLLVVHLPFTNARKSILLSPCRRDFAPFYSCSHCPPPKSHGAFLFPSRRAGLQHLYPEPVLSALVGTARPVTGEAPVERI